MSQTSLRLRVVPRYPANVTATDGLKTVRSGVDLVVKSDYSNLVQVPTVTNPDKTFMLAWDSDIDNYQSMSFTNIINNIQDAVIGPPLAAIDATNPGANQVVYFTDVGVASTYTSSDFVRGISNAPDQDSFVVAAGAATSSQGTKADSALQPSDLTTTATISKGLKAFNVDGSGIPGVGIPTNGMIFRQSSGLQENGGVFRVERLANYSGGTFGFENAAFMTINTVSLGADSFEDALLSILDNNASGSGQNTAGRFQANKRAAGAVWSLANESIDWTGVGEPTTPLIGIEQAIRANGTDQHAQRIGYDAILSRPTTDGSYSGLAAQGTYAFRASIDYIDTAANNWRVAFGAVSSGDAFFGDGLDLSGATITGRAIRLANGQEISFTKNGDRTIRYDFGAFRLNNSSVDHWVVNDNGSSDQFGPLKIQGVQVVTSTRPGWSADTGTAKRTANVTYSATADAAYTQSTVQNLMNAVRDLSQTVKALKDDLIAHGLIGA